MHTPLVGFVGIYPEQQVRKVLNNHREVASRGMPVKRVVLNVLYNQAEGPRGIAIKRIRVAGCFKNDGSQQELCIALKGGRRCKPP